MASEPSFRIVTMPAICRVAVIMDGFWQRNTFELFAAQIGPAVASLDTAGQHTMLCDASGCTVATAEVITMLFDGLVRGDICPVRARKIAIVMASPLSRLQIDRLRAARPGLEAFDNRADAETWLRIPSPTLAAAGA